MRVAAPETYSHLFSSDGDNDDPSEEDDSSDDEYSSVGDFLHRRRLYDRAIPYSAKEKTVVYSTRFVFSYKQCDLYNYMK
jgi:hypothetical protein